MFDKIFGSFGMLAIGIVCFIVLIVGGLYVTMGTETTEFNTDIQQGTTSIPTP